MASRRHHLKAQEILANLDAARTQRQVNDNSRNTVLDVEDVLSQLHEQLFTRKMHKDISNAYKACMDQMYRYEEQLDFSATTRRHNDDRYIAECELEVPVSKLTTEDAVPNTRAVTFGLAKINQFSADQSEGARHIGQFLEDAEEIFNNVERLIENQRIEEEPWHGVIAPVMTMLETLLKSRSAQEPLLATEDEVDALDEREQQLEQRQSNTISEGNVAEAEVICMKRITLLEGIVDLVTHKFDLLDHEEKNFVDQLRAEVKQNEQEAKTRAKAIRATIDTRKQNLNKDLMKLKAESSKAEADEDLARSAFIKEKEASNEFLSKNHLLQEECWAEIHAIETKLGKLAGERRVEIDSRVKMFEREERRRVDMRHFTDFVSSHSQLLQVSLRCCEAEDTVAGKMEEVVDGACSAVHSRVLELEKELSALRTQVLYEHYSYFRKQYLLVGDAMYKKDRYIDEMGKKIDLETIQQHLKMDSLDAGARLHANNSAALEREREGAVAQVEVLKRKADLYVAAFKPTERGLILTGMSFVHPVQELVEVNRGKGKNLASYHATMVSEVDMIGPNGKNRLSKGELEREIEMLNKDKELVEAARRKKKLSGNRSIKLPAVQEREVVDSETGEVTTIVETASGGGNNRHQVVVESSVSSFMGMGLD